MSADDFRDTPIQVATIMAPDGSQPFLDYHHLVTESGLGTPIPVNPDPEAALTHLLPKGFTGHEGVRPTEDDIAGWCRTKPGWNLGIRIADDIIGIDFDDPTYAHLELYESLGMELTPYTTGRGPGPRRHMFFRLPPGFDMATLKERKPVDLLRPWHRFSLTVGSRHKLGGQVRRFDVDGSDLGATLPNRDSLQELPVGVIEYLSRGRSVTAKRVPAIRETQQRKYEAALSKAVSSIELGSIHNALVSGSASLSPFFPAGVGDIEKARDALFDRVAEVGGDVDNPAHHDAVDSGLVHFADDPVEILAESEDYLVTQADVAGYFASHAHPDEFLYAAKLKCWFIFDGTLWRRDHGAVRLSGVIVHELQRLEAMFLGRAESVEDNESEVKTLFSCAKSIKQLGSATGVSGIERLLRSLFLCDPDEFDADPDLISTPGGVINAATSEVRPHRASDKMTTMTSGSYIPGFTHPDWDAAMVALDQAELDWFGQVIGFALSGHMSEVLLLLVSPGGSGKSMMLQPIISAFGEDYAIALDNDVLGHRELHPTHTYALKGARLGVSEEIPAGNSLNMGSVKKLTSPRIPGRPIQGDAGFFKATHQLIASANSLPSSVGTQNSEWRRLAVLPFDKTFLSDTDTEEEIAAAKAAEAAGAAVYTDSSGVVKREDAALMDRLIRGRTGQHDAIITWAVGHLFESRGFPRHQTDRIKVATMEWRLRADAISSALETHTVAADDSVGVYIGALWHEYASGCKAAGVSAYSRARFEKELSTHRFVEGLAVRVPAAGDSISSPEVPLSSFEADFKPTGKSLALFGREFSTGEVSRWVMDSGSKQGQADVAITGLLEAGGGEWTRQSLAAELAVSLGVSVRTARYRVDDSKVVVVVRERSSRAGGDVIGLA